MKTIFGREPAMILALISSIVMMLSAFFIPLTPEQAGAINAVAVALVGLTTGFSVASDGGLAVIVGLLKAALALGIAFGLHMPPEQQAIAMSFATTVAQLFVRTQVTATIPSD